MNLSDRINKIKIALFGNIWSVRIVKLLRYLSVILVGWWISKSKYLFPKPSNPWTTFTSMLRWEERKFEELVMGISTLFFFFFLVFIFFYLSGLLVEWLVRVNISPHQQIKIIEKKLYTIDEKTNYSVEKIDNLESAAFRGSSYVSLKGILSLKDGKNKKTINFICHSHSSIIDPYLSPNNLETYFPQTDIKFKQKTFFTWQKITFVFLSLGAVFFLFRVYKDIEAHPNHPAGWAIKGKVAIQAQIAKDQKEKDEEKLKADRRREAKITAPEEIKFGFEAIGGLEKAVRECKANAQAIQERNKDPNSLVEPYHMLLYGPPGTGKTFLAQSIAKDSESFFLNLNGADFETSLAEAFGNTSGPNAGDKMKKIFDIALEEAGDKTIVALIDEIDRMGGFSGQEIASLLSLLSGATSEKYKRIKIIATTNHMRKLDPALLRSERIGIKLLIGYPNSKELAEIIKKVLSKFHDENFKRKGGADALGNLGKVAFVNKFAKPMHEIMSSPDFSVTYQELLRGVTPPPGIQPDDKRILFTGADASEIISRSLSIMKRRGGRTLTTDHIKQATKDMYKSNRADPRWRWIAGEFIEEELWNEFSEEDRRKLEEERLKGPRGPR